jgi:hypothetical protein
VAWVHRTRTRRQPSLATAILRGVAVAAVVAIGALEHGAHPPTPGSVAAVVPDANAPTGAGEGGAQVSADSVPVEGFSFPAVRAPEAFTPDATDVDMAVAVLTDPDSGPAGHTYRWATDTVTYTLDLPGYPSSYFGEIDAALTFIADTTGVRWVQVERGGQVRIVPLGDNGGRVRMHAGSGHTLTGATIELGCCRVRVPWEELLQAMGALGDHTDGRSVFSNRTPRERAGSWEAWALRTLYSLPPGSSPDQIRNALAAG